MQATRTFPQQTLGHYQILRETGRGGMSLVYEALDQRIGRRVALKALSVPMSLTPEMRESMIARLKREARAIARLSHPNIVMIYDIGEEAGQHFLVMEFLEGITLRERLDQGPMPPDEALAILDQVAAGLDAVHAAGIVHRDIKPSNVMLLPDGLVKLMDFGVARQNEDTLVTQAGTMVGSPVYMSPEQINGEASTAASDLWSLGIVLYEMLAGQPPFAGGNIPNVLYQVTHLAPPRLSRALPAVQKVLDRALDKNPAQRFHSAQELVDAFRAAALPALTAPDPVPRLPLAAETPAARTPPHSRIPRSFRPTRIARPIAWAMGLLLLTLLTALPQLLHPRRATFPSVVVVNRPASSTPPVLVAKAMPPPRSLPISVTRQPASVARQPKPVIRVAAYRQQQRSRPIRRAPRHSVKSLSPAVKSQMGYRHNARRHTIPPLPREAQRKRAFHSVETARSPMPLVSPTQTKKSSPSSASSLLGTWHGRHSHNPATLEITHRDGNTFAGTMSVRTPEANVRIAVSGRVSPGTGEITMHETRILSSSRPRAWDLGSESGHVAANGQIEGEGSDIKGRHGLWSFSR